MLKVRHLGWGIAALIVCAASSAHAVTISYTSDCWYTGTDADHDGLNDTCEQQLAQAFQPLMWFDSGEDGNGRRPYFLVSSVSYAGRQVKIFYADTYFQDAGVVSGHDGDPEFQIAYVTLSGTTWSLDWFLMSQHRNSWCDSTTWYYWDELYYNYGSRNRPTIAVAEDKHASYNNLSNCEDGCEWTDHCSWSSWENFDQGQGFAGRNLGQTSSQLVNYVYFNGEDEWMFSNEFAGWDDNWYWANSDGYQTHFTYFGF